MLCALFLLFLILIPPSVLMATELPGTEQKQTIEHNNIPLTLDEVSVVGWGL